MHRVWKHPVRPPPAVRRLNIDGDRQGDLAGHGGEQRAVLVYQPAPTGTGPTNWAATTCGPVAAVVDLGSNPTGYRWPPRR